MTPEDALEYRGCVVRITRSRPDLGVAAGDHGIILDTHVPPNMAWLRMFKRTKSAAGAEKRDSCPDWVPGYVVGLVVDDFEFDEDFEFKNGQRVIRVLAHEGADSDVGQRGTVLTNDDTPWVEFDTPVRYPHAVLNGKAGHCDAIPGVHLAYIEDEYGTISVDVVDTDSPTFMKVERKKWLEN